jgi:hypothetical protein
MAKFCSPDRARWTVAVAMLALTAQSAAVAGSCDPALAHTIESVQRNMPPLQDPAMHRWLSQEFGWIRAACARGNDVEAVWRLENIVSRTSPHAAGTAMSTVAAVSASSRAPMPRTAQDVTQ